jgi:TatA/E family protein of Tat protein translocase
VIGDILQPTHLIFILVVALLVLGPKRLPEVGRSLGKGIRDFRGALSGMDEDRSTPVPEPAPITPATTTMSPSMTVADPAPDPAHGYVPVEEATAAMPTPVSQVQTVALDEHAVADASAARQQPEPGVAARAASSPDPAGAQPTAEEVAPSEAGTAAMNVADGTPTNG